MTDEEMAEEYAGSFEWTNDDRIIDYSKQGFLAGLKASRPQWHDLRKDPNDLPKRNKDFVVEVTIPVMTHPSYVFAAYYFDNKKWFSDGEEIKVIAWCEIPQFKE